MKHAAFWILCLPALYPVSSMAQIIDGRASTVEEGWARGTADIIRSRADANLSNSQAAINAQDAYSRAITNSVDSVSAYWERRKINEAQRAEKRFRRRRYAKDRNLKPLTASEFDRTTGIISWPEPMQHSQYSEYRDVFDAVFAKRADEGWLDSDDYLRAASASTDWREMLKNQRGEVPTELLREMVRFVLKLDRELNENLS